MKQQVADLMSRPVTVIRRACDVHELEKLLVAERIHGVPVVDDESRIVGVVSQSDLLRWHYELGVDGACGAGVDERAIPEQRRDLHVSDIRTARIDEIMSLVVHVIGPQQPIAEAAARMIDEEIHRLIVVDQEFHVLGMLSAIDVLRAMPGLAAYRQRRRSACRAGHVA